MEMREALTLVLASPIYGGDLVSIFDGDSDWCESQSVTFMDREDNITKVDILVDDSGSVFLTVTRRDPPTLDDLDDAMEAYFDGDDEALDGPFQPF